MNAPGLPRPNERHDRYCSGPAATGYSAVSRNPHLPRPEEPPAPSPELADLSNLVLTPHVGAGTGAALMADVREVLENIARVRAT